MRRKKKKIRFFTVVPWKYHIGQIQQGLEILSKSEYPLFTEDGFDSGLVYLIVARPYVDKSKTFFGRLEQKYIDRKQQKKRSLKKQIKELKKENEELKTTIRKSKILTGAEARKFFKIVDNAEYNPENKTRMEEARKTFKEWNEQLKNYLQKKMENMATEQPITILNELEEILENIKKLEEALRNIKKLKKILEDIKKLEKENKRLQKLEWSAKEILQQYQNNELPCIGEYPDTFEAGYYYAMHNLKELNK